MLAPSRSLLVASSLLAVVACGGAPSDSPTPAAAPTAFDLPTEQAERYRTAYISRVVAAPAGDDLAPGAGEHVVIANNADIRIDMGGWVLVDAQGNRLPLGIGRQIDVGAQLRVHTGCGTDTEAAVFACSDAEVLDDAGDVIRLLDAADAEVAELAYGTTAE